MSDKPINSTIDLTEQQNYTEAFSSLSKLMKDLIETQKNILNNIATMNSNYDHLQKTVEKLTIDIKEDKEEMESIITDLQTSIGILSSTDTEVIDHGTNLWKNPKLKKNS